MNSSYLILKSLHLIFMVAWFAGLFYIFRLFVYHVHHKEDAKMGEAYSVMERKLLYVIMHPAMTLTFIFGLSMLYLNPALWQMAWIKLKIVFVLLLLVYQIFAAKTHKRFKKGDFFLTEKACRMINEVPTLLLIVIIFLAILKPF